VPSIGKKLISALTRPLTNGMWSETTWKKWSNNLRDQNSQIFTVFNDLLSHHYTGKSESWVDHCIQHGSSQKGNLLTKKLFFPNWAKKKKKKKKKHDILTLKRESNASYRNGWKQNSFTDVELRMHNKWNCGQFS